MLIHSLKSSSTLWFSSLCFWLRLGKEHGLVENRNIHISTRHIVFIFNDQNHYCSLTLTKLLSPKPNHRPESGCEHGSLVIVYVLSLVFSVHSPLSSLPLILQICTVLCSVSLLTDLYPCFLLITYLSSNYLSKP